MSAVADGFLHSGRLPGEQFGAVGDPAPTVRVAGTVGVAAAQLVVEDHGSPVGELFQVVAGPA